MICCPVICKYIFSYWFTLYLINNNVNYYHQLYEFTQVITYSVYSTATVQNKWQHKCTNYVQISLQGIKDIAQHSYFGDEAISLVLELQPVSAKSKQRENTFTEVLHNLRKKAIPKACWSKERWQGLGIILPVSSKFGFTVYISFSLLAWTRHASSTLQRQASI